MRHSAPHTSLHPRPSMEAQELLAAALGTHGEALATELRLLDEMPQVKLCPACVFDRSKPLGSTANKRGVICKLLCCGGQLVKKCNTSTGTNARPTLVEAARHLREAVSEEHGSEACTEKGRQAKEALTSRPAPPEHAFAAIMGAQIVSQRASAALKLAQERADITRRRTEAAVRESEAAAKELAFHDDGDASPRDW
mmetsp:Transcript_30291/g.65122  ORF Transcript_30291/g.65122 Transcript_30291/m.65122 type:complete len:197 (-) Transcript_30291:94-684(-)